MISPKQMKSCEIMRCVKRVQIRSFFWSVFSRIWTEYGDLRSIQENTDHKKFRIWTLFHTVAHVD